MKTVIKWNANLNGVEIEFEGVHFVVDANPSYVMNWDDAVRFYKDNKVWQLPTREHLKLIVEHLDEVNALIEANGGYKIRGWHWTADEYNVFSAWPVHMYYGYNDYDHKSSNHYVRAVSVLVN